MTRQRRLEPTDARQQQPTRSIDSPYLTAKEAVLYLRLPSLDALYALIEQWQLPYGRLGRCYRFNKRHLDLWIERRGVPAISEARRA